MRPGGPNDPITLLTISCSHHDILLITLQLSRLFSRFDTKTVLLVRGNATELAAAVARPSSRRPFFTCSLTARLEIHCLRQHPRSGPSVVSPATRRCPRQQSRLQSGRWTTASTDVILHPPSSILQFEHPAGPVRPTIHALTSPMEKSRNVTASMIKRPRRDHCSAASLRWQIKTADDHGHDRC